MAADDAINGCGEVYKKTSITQTKNSGSTGSTGKTSGTAGKTSGSSNRTHEESEEERQTREMERERRETYCSEYYSLSSSRSKTPATSNPSTNSNSSLGEDLTEEERLTREIEEDKKEFQRETLATAQKQAEEAREKYFEEVKAYYASENPNLTDEEIKKKIKSGEYYNEKKAKEEQEQKDRLIAEATDFYMDDDETTTSLSEILAAREAAKRNVENGQYQLDVESYVKEQEAKIKAEQQRLLQQVYADAYVEQYWQNYMDDDTASLSQINEAKAKARNAFVTGNYVYDLLGVSQVDASWYMDDDTASLSQIRNAEIQAQNAAAYVFIDAQMMDIDEKLAEIDAMGIFSSASSIAERDRLLEQKKQLEALRNNPSTQNLKKYFEENNLVFDLSETSAAAAVAQTLMTTKIDESDTKTYASSIVEQAWLEFRTFRDAVNSSIDSQGIISDAISTANILIGAGTNEEQVKALLNHRYELLCKLEQAKTPDEFASLYKALYGTNLSIDTLKADISIDISSVQQTLANYEQSQEDNLNALTTTISTIATASMGPIGAFLAGGALNLGLHFVDAGTQNNGLSTEENAEKFIKEEGLTKFLSGGTAAFSNSFANSVGTKAASKIIKNSVGTEVFDYFVKKEGLENAVKILETTTSRRVKETIEGILDGTIGAVSDYMLGVIFEGEDLSVDRFIQTVGAGMAFGGLTGFGLGEVLDVGGNVLTKFNNVDASGMPADLNWNFNSSINPDVNSNIIRNLDDYQLYSSSSNVSNPFEPSRTITGIDPRFKKLLETEKINTPYTRALSRDIELLKLANETGLNVLDLDVPTFKSINEALSNIENAAIFEVQGVDKIYMKMDDVNFTQLNISKEAYNKLFPVGQRFNAGQVKSGACYIYAPVSSIYYSSNPQIKIKALEIFSENADGSIVCQLPNSAQNIILKQGQSIDDLCSSVNPLLRFSDCTGLQMIEMAYKVHLLTDAELPIEKVKLFIPDADKQMSYAEIQKIKLSEELDFAKNNLDILYKYAKKEWGCESFEDYLHTAELKYDELKNTIENKLSRTISDTEFSLMLDNIGTNVLSSELQISDEIALSISEVLDDYKGISAKVLSNYSFLNKTQDNTLKNMLFADAEKISGFGGSPEETLKRLGLNIYPINLEMEKDMLTLLSDSSEIMDGIILSAGTKITKQGIIDRSKINEDPVKYIKDNYPKDYNNMYDNAPENLKEGLVPGHAVSLQLSIDADGTKKWVYINPHYLDSRYPKIVTLTTEELIDNFDNICIATDNMADFANKINKYSERMNSSSYSNSSVDYYSLPVSSNVDMYSINTSLLDKYKVNKNKKYLTEQEFAKSIDIMEDGIYSIVNDNVWASIGKSSDTKIPWKMHVYAANEKEFQDLFDIIAPYVWDNKIEAKSLSGYLPMFSDVENGFSKEQFGKAFTIYPSSIEQMRKIATELDYIIKNNNLQTSSSSIIGDNMLGDSGRLFYRYEYKSGKYSDLIIDYTKDKIEPEIAEKYGIPQSYSPESLYKLIYERNRGGNNYLADDMFFEDDIWKDFHTNFQMKKNNFFSCIFNKLKK